MQASPEPNRRSAILPTITVLFGVVGVVVGIVAIKRSSEDGNKVALESAYSAQLQALQLRQLSLENDVRDLQQRTKTIEKHMSLPVGTDASKSRFDQLQDSIAELQTKMTDVEKRLPKRKAAK
jgi:peptidoglycan hydrolase CwlO-like protein